MTRWFIIVTTASVLGCCLGCGAGFGGKDASEGGASVKGSMDQPEEKDGREPLGVGPGSTSEGSAAGSAGGQSSQGESARGAAAPEGLGGASGGGNGSSREGDAAEEIFRVRRERMVRGQIAARGIRDERVLAAMRKVPRHLFIPESERGSAYDDGPVPIGDGQTISQPYIVALMTELVRPSPNDRVLEVGSSRVDLQACKLEYSIVSPK